MIEADRQRRVIELLSQALELRGDARRAFLDRECGAEGELRQELEALLAEESAADDGFLDVPAVADLAERRVATGADSPATEPMAAGRMAPPLPERLGPYRVVARRAPGPLPDGRRPADDRFRLPPVGAAGGGRDASG